VVYAEHGNHYHDINTFDRPLHPFRREGPLERPPAARLGDLRRLASGRASAFWIRDAVADLLPRRHPRSAVRSQYHATLRAYADELGLAVDVVARLHELGGASILRIARRLMRSRSAGAPRFPEQLPHIAARVHEVLSSGGRPAAFYVFGHTHVAQHVRLPGTRACYLNTGTWSSDRTESASASADRPEPAQCTWVEIARRAGGPPNATLLRWTGIPMEVPGPIHGAAYELEETGHGGVGQVETGG
jgi:hypothetical protein